MAPGTTGRQKSKREDGGTHIELRGMFQFRRHGRHTFVFLLFFCTRRQGNEKPDGRFLVPGTEESIGSAFPVRLPVIETDATHFADAPNKWCAPAGRVRKKMLHTSSSRMRLESLVPQRTVRRGSCSYGPVFYVLSILCLCFFSSTLLHRPSLPKVKRALRPLEVRPKVDNGAYSYSVLH